MFAFLPTLGFQEMLILLVIGLLLYGRNLPDVGRQLGKTVAQLKRGMAEFKHQMDADGTLRDAKRTLQDTMQEVKRVTDVPRAIAEPGRMLRDLTNEALSSPDPTPAEPMPPDQASSKPAPTPEPPA